MAPLSVSPSNKVSSTQIPITWQHIPQQYIHGRLRGYHIKYKLIELADNPIDDHGYRVTVVWPNATNVTLMSLESYATYEIEIAGFTSKGDGVWRKVFGSRFKLSLCEGPSGGWGWGGVGAPLKSGKECATKGFENNPARWK